MLVGPLGLLVAISLSLWVSTRQVERSVVVQVEREWVSGEALAVRAELLDGALQGIEGTPVELSVRTRHGRTPLGRIEPVRGGGVAQGMVDLPRLDPGPATLELRFLDPTRRPTSETIDVEVVSERPPRAGEHTISTSTLQYGDDTDPQPSRLRIDLRPFGRILAGFDNRFTVRVTDVDGQPWSGPVAVSLVYGELDGQVGKDEDPPRIVEGTTDDAGLLEFDGMLSSEVVRFEVVARHDPPEQPSRRRFRLVSFPGGVQLTARPLMVHPGDTVNIEPRALRARRPVFLDVHGPDGGWMATLDPVVPSADAEIEYAVPSSGPEGFVQVEAYHYTNAPGEGSAVARFFVAADDPDDAHALVPLIEAHRAHLDTPRVEKSFDAALERAHLDALADADLSPRELARARRWLVGSLPLEVYGPPLALTTRDREDADLGAFKRNWTLGLRWLLIGGGVLFMLVTAVSLYSSYREIARRTAEVLGDDAESVTEAGRAMLGRAGYVMGLVLITLVLTVLLLESLVFEF